MIQAGLSIAIMLFIFAMAFFIQNKIETRNQQITLEKEAIVNTISMYDIYKNSLQSTWRISTLQSIFESSDGFGNEYWYSHDPSKPIKTPSDTIIECGGNPAICLPTLQNISHDIGNLIRDEYVSPLEYPKIVTANLIDLSISNFYITVWPGYDKIISNISHVITSESNLNTLIKTQTTVRSRVDIINTYDSNLKKMIYAGYLMVENAIDISDSISIFRYNDYNSHERTEDHVVFENEISEFIERKFVLTDTFYTNKIENTDVDIIVSDHTTNEVVRDQGGLVAKYEHIETFFDDEQYYRDTGVNFTLNNFELTVKARDYFPILDCSSLSGTRRFTWESSSNLDILCTQGSEDSYREIYTCNIDSIEGIKSDNKITTGKMVGLFECVSGFDQVGGNIFCIIGDEDNSDPMFARCCTQRKYNENIDTFWAGGSNTCDGNTFCIGDGHALKSRGEICDTGRTCSDNSKSNAQANGCNFYCDAKGHMFTCRADIRNCGDLTNFNDAYSSGSCSTTCGTGTPTYDSHIGFATDDTPLAANRCFNSNECRTENICTEIDGLPHNKGSTFSNSCKVYQCEDSDICPVTASFVKNVDDGTECDEVVGGVCSSGVCGLPISDEPDSPTTCEFGFVCVGDFHRAFRSENCDTGIPISCEFGCIGEGICDVE